MKVCFILPNAWIGGIRTFSLNLGQQFNKDGHTISFVIATRYRQGLELGDLSEFKKIGDVHLCTSSRIIIRSNYLNLLINTIDCIKPDILILSNNIWAQATLPFLDPTIIRLVVVHNVLDEEINLAIAHSSYWDALIAVGAGLAGLLHMKCAHSKVHLIPVGVVETPTNEERSLSDHVLNIIYCGRVEQHQKNVLIIPDIASELVKRNLPFRWTILGDGPDLTELVEKVSAMRMSELFTFVGACDGKLTLQIMSDQHILVLPSHFESIGHVLLEAQMLGVLPIASRIPGATDYVVNHGQNGFLCEPGNILEFANAIQKISDDRSLLEQLSKSAKKDVRQVFEISKIAMQYYQLFDLLKQSKRTMTRKRRFLGYVRVPVSVMPSRYTTIKQIVKSNLSQRISKLIT